MRGSRVPPGAWRARGRFRGRDRSGEGRWDHRGPKADRQSGGRRGEWPRAGRFCWACLSPLPLEFKAQGARGRLGWMHELDRMGAPFGAVCRGHGATGQSGRGARGLKPGHGGSHQRGSGVCLGHRAGAGQARRDAAAGQADAAVSRVVRAGYGAELAVLLPRAATGPGLARGPAGQAERAAGDGFCMAAAGREANLACSPRRTVDYSGSDCDGAGVKEAGNREQGSGIRTDSNAQGGVRRIVLTGFMGSGKSTVGPLVAKKLGWRFIEVDDVIVAETGAPIHVFFARHGEVEFRKREHATIARLVNEDGLVLALGGGAIETDATRELLLDSPGTLLVQ